MNIDDMKVLDKLDVDYRSFIEGASCTIPKDVMISDIDTLIVDPHNQAVLHWYKIKGRDSPSVLIHIDKHDDMSPSAPILDDARFESKSDDNLLDVYIRNYLNVDNFICFAVSQDIVGAVYHIDPRESYVTGYGRVRRSSFIERIKAKEYDERIRWSRDFHNGKILTYRQFIGDIKSSKFPLILDIDLDAFLCKYESSPSWLYGLDVLYKNRLAKTMNLLEYLPKPDLITVARSQNPGEYVPPKYVNDIERDLLLRLNDLYQQPK